MKKIDTLTIQPSLAQSPYSLPANASPAVHHFFNTLYTHLYQALDITHTSIRPHIDADAVKLFIAQLLGNLSQADTTALRRLGIEGNSVNTKEWNKDADSKALLIFLSYCPCFIDFLSNIHPLASLAIKSYETVTGQTINTQNFIAVKQRCDAINRVRWTRTQTTSEQQSGVSNLGAVSELLLAKALEKQIDRQNFFRTHNQDIQSYGDFILMCLPNNLWLSVKSNFARERLLASGYTTDIIGVGFFTDKNEFTSRSKIRNLQRVGFLAMYLPDIPVSEDQIQNNTNTYDEVVAAYAAQNLQLPLNINGTAFIRKLSAIESDMGKLLSITNVANRTTLDF